MIAWLLMLLSMSSFAQMDLCQGTWVQYLSCFEKKTIQSAEACALKTLSSELNVLEKTKVLEFGTLQTLASRELRKCADIGKSSKGRYQYCSDLPEGGKSLVPFVQLQFSMKNKKCYISEIRY